MKHLEHPTVSSTVLRSLRAADFSLWITALNVVELSKHFNGRVRQRLFAILKRLAANKGILPLPDQLLRQAALAWRDGEAGFKAQLRSLDGVLDEDGEPSPAFRAAATEFTTTFDGSRTQAFSQARPEVQRKLKGRFPREWYSPKDFLDWWLVSEPLAGFLERIWTDLDLPAPSRYTDALNLATWRLYVEAEGILLWRSVVSPRERGRTTYTDLSQLIYLAGAERRILVTDDRNLREAALDVTAGRYSQTSVEGWDAFQAHHT